MTTCQAQLHAMGVHELGATTLMCDLQLGHYDEGCGGDHSGWHLDQDHEVRWCDAAEGAVPSAIELMSAEQVAQLFHETYERLAPAHGYETREATSVAWSDVPEPNRSLMIAVADVVASTVRREMREAGRDPVVAGGEG